MDYKANYQAWLQDPRLSEEGRKELESIKDNEKELDWSDWVMKNMNIVYHNVRMNVCMRIIRNWTSGYYTKFYKQNSKNNCL